MRLTQSDLQAHLGVYRLTVGEWVVVSYAAFVLGAGFFSIGYLLAKGFHGNATYRF